MLLLRLHSLSKSGYFNANVFVSGHIQQYVPTLRIAEAKATF